MPRRPSPLHHALYLLLLPALLTAQTRPNTTGLSRILESDLRHDLTLHASDAYRGREAGTLDELRASTWLAQQMAAIGVVPAGEDGTYFEWWNLRRHRLAATSRVRIEGEAADLPLWSDLIVTAPTDARLDAAPVVWAGTGDDSTITVRGRVAVAQLVAPPVPPAAGVSLAEWRYARAAITRQSRLLRERGATAVILVADATSERAWDFYMSNSRRGTYAVEAEPVTPRPDATVPVLFARAALRDRLQAARQLTLDLRSEWFTFPSVNVVG